MLFKVENANTFVKNATRDRRRRPEKPDLEPVLSLTVSENGSVARLDDKNTRNASTLDESNDRTNDPTLDEKPNR